MIRREIEKMEKGGERNNINNHESATTRNI